MQGFKGVGYRSTLRKSLLLNLAFIRVNVTNHSLPFWDEEEECRPSDQMFLQSE